MLIAGEGVSAPHVELGMLLIEQAAASGDASACTFLGQCYAHGVHGKNRDPEKSNLWFSYSRNNERFIERGDPVDIEADGLLLTKPQVEWT